MAAIRAQAKPKACKCFDCKNPCAESDLAWTLSETGEQGYICPDCRKRISAELAQEFA